MSIAIVCASRASLVKDGGHTPAIASDALRAGLNMPDGARTATVPRISIGIQREPPSEYLGEGQAALDRFFPRSDCLSWLLLDWCSDDKGDPIERFVIYQMLPAQYIMPDMLEALKGPHPDMCGYWEMWRGAKRWHSTAPPGVTGRKWELWREHKCEARMLWIVQGSGGGHRYRVPMLEKKARRMCGLTPDTPPPGDLPYAPPDWRVFENLLDLDDVRKFQTVIADVLNRKPEFYDRVERQAAEDARWALRKWWSRQVDQMIDEAGMRWWARNRSDFPYSGEDELRKEEIELEQFITDAPIGASA
jgi:hypothetical protein